MWSSLAHIVLVSNCFWEYSHSMVLILTLKCKKNCVEKKEKKQDYDCDYARLWLKQGRQTVNLPLTSICLPLHSVCAVKWQTWAILSQITCLMTRTCCVVGIVCALYLWRSHSLERIVHPCILPTCGVVINKAAWETYNDSMRLLLRAPRSSSASHMFVNVGVPTCSAVVRNLMFRFMCRASESENKLIAYLVDPVLFCQIFFQTLEPLANMSVC